MAKAPAYDKAPANRRGDKDGGRPAEIDVQLKKGVLELCVLAVIARRDSYAYEIARELSEGIDMGEGTIYPLMRRLERLGLLETYSIDSPSGPPRKYYRLTHAGQETVGERRAGWETFARAVDAIVGVTK